MTYPHRLVVTRPAEPAIGNDGLALDAPEPAVLYDGPADVQDGYEMGPRTSSGDRLLQYDARAFVDALPAVPIQPGDLVTWPTAYGERVGEVAGVRLLDDLLFIRWRA